MTTITVFEGINPSCRGLLGTAAQGALNGLPEHASPATGRNAIRPFRVDIPETALVDLRNRLIATRLPERETVSDNSQGVPLATVQKLVRYWATEYDWRKIETK